MTKLQHITNYSDSGVVIPWAVKEKKKACSQSFEK